MASDSGMGEPVMGDSVSLAISGKEEDVQRLQSYFKSFSEQGTVTMPLAPAPWNAEFGMVTDKFGIHWMVNIEKSMPAIT